MESSTWCAHDHTVVVRLAEKEGFTVESPHHTSDYLVTEVRVRQTVNEPEKRTVAVQGCLLNKNGTPSKRHTTRPYFDWSLIPDRVKALAESQLAAMACGVA